MFHGGRRLFFFKEMDKLDKQKVEIEIGFVLICLTIHLNTSQLTGHHSHPYQFRLRSVS